jgi:1,4-dihydroxy-2-naphthoyl-CoA synthase
LRPKNRHAALLVVHFDSQNVSPRALPGGFWGSNAAVRIVLTGPRAMRSGTRTAGHKREACLHGWCGHYRVPRKFRAALKRNEELPFPTIAVINGFAMGGGFELCLDCDYRLMSSSTRVGLPETRLGLIPVQGGAAPSACRA